MNPALCAKQRSIRTIPLFLPPYFDFPHAVGDNNLNLDKTTWVTVSTAPGAAGADDATIAAGKIVIRNSPCLADPEDRAEVRT
jgi:hypothetical protein